MLLATHTKLLTSSSGILDWLITKTTLAILLICIHFQKKILLRG